MPPRGPARRYGDGVNDFKIAERDDAVSALPRALRVSAALSWRTLVILGAVYVLGLVLGQIYVVVIPVAIAMLLSALLAPLVAGLARRGVPRALATALVLIGGLAVVGGVLTFVISAFIDGFPDLQRQVIASLTALKTQLAESPLQINDAQIDNYLQQAQDWLQANQAMLTSGALSTAGTFGNFLTGLVLALFTLIYFLHDGRGVWLFVIKLAPKHVRAKVDRAGCRGFESLVGYVRATAMVAVVDALGIGLGLVILGVPLAIPLAALVFLGGFVPIVGAVASGSVAVLVALVTKGWVTALIVVGVVLLVQQLEGNVLQPLLLGRAVQLHALAVVLAISIGAVVSGIVGALLAVPLVAVLNASIRSLVDEDEPEPEVPLEPAPDEPADPPEDKEPEPTADR
ncbi:Predicted PurR-regulated permease PerM [Saccharopolyspora kobensis]|uniref:Predicted PurR-regulated permease PerM n=2 Tax=Saccharopolyspora kobensis TaxID=146035 RepID=A0A1H6DJ09_9PSEU|nr:Predicted PurR-regulated permease PerM [Saccharopolyspora kobensis]SFD25098.1 Predicted PurR-regulated permease PerM [Saccharopolyspora kobensis]